MTLLGVGGGALNSGGSTTLGGIGSGYIYAAWKGQVAYTTPNFNGFQATVGITNPNQGIAVHKIITVQHSLLLLAYSKIVLVLKVKLHIALQQIISQEKSG